LRVEPLIEQPEVLHAQSVARVCRALLPRFLEQSEHVALAQDEFLLALEERRLEDVWPLKVLAQVVVIVAEQLGDDEQERVLRVRTHQLVLGLLEGRMQLWVLGEAMEHDEGGIGALERDRLGMVREEGELGLESIEQGSVVHCVQIVRGVGSGEGSSVAQESGFCND
jgi:hypothetical protein